MLQHLIKCCNITAQNLILATHRKKRNVYNWKIWIDFAFEFVYFPVLKKLFFIFQETEMDGGSNGVYGTKKYFDCKKGRGHFIASSKCKISKTPTIRGNYHFFYIDTKHLLFELINF